MESQPESSALTAPSTESTGQHQTTTTVVRRNKASATKTPRPSSTATSRETIRMKLASEPPVNSISGAGANNSEANLLVCFMNEVLDTDDSDDDNNDRDDDQQRRLAAVAAPDAGPTAGSGSGSGGGGIGGAPPYPAVPGLEKLSAKYIARNNISTKKNHVIIPLKDSDSDDAPLSPEPVDLPFTPPPKRCSHVAKADKAQVSDSEALSLWLVQIQLEAREKLRRAKAEAKRTLLAEGEREKRLLSHDLERLLSLKVCLGRRLNRQFLTERNIAQLQVILNYLLSRIEELNEKLVEYLMAKDELVMEQDSLLTDIEDIRKGIENATF